MTIRAEHNYNFSNQFSLIIENVFWTSPANTLKTFLSWQLNPITVFTSDLYQDHMLTFNKTNFWSLDVWYITFWIWRILKSVAFDRLNATSKRYEDCIVMDHNGSLYNHTDEEDGHESGGFVAMLDTPAIILAVLIIVTNGVVLWLFGKNHRLRNITNTFLVSLAISDLTTGVLGIPFYLVCSVTQKTLCYTTEIFWRFSSTSTVLHLLVVTLDRYAAIVHAIRYISIVTRARACVAIISVWSLAAIVALIKLSWPNIEDVKRRNGSEEEMQKVETMTGVFQAITIGVIFALPLLVIVFSYIRIFYIVRYHDKQIKRQNLPSDPTISRKQSVLEIPAQWKSAIVFIVMTALYVICWFPYFFYAPLQELTHKSPLPNWVYYVFFYYPRFMTSLTNPIIYIVGKHDFRKALRPRRHKERHNTHTTSLIVRGRSS